MAERLVKVAKELNVGLSTIVDFLAFKGYVIENKPTTQISDEMHSVLLKEFSSSMIVKNTMSPNDPNGLAHAKNLIAENLKTKEAFLDLGNCGLRDLSELPELWECQHLEGLNMSPWYWGEQDYIKSKNSYSINQIGDAGVKLIANNLKHLISLDLSTNKIGFDSIKAISENIKSLISLSLRNVKIGDEGAKLISENLTSLSFLDLSSNIIGTSGTQIISQNLKQLTSLNLESNKIGIAGVKAICNNLKQIISLNLSNNGIGNEGAKIISESLTFLKFLSLGSNNIENEGAKEIGKNLKLLTYLNLSWNLIGDEGVKTIAQNLKLLTSLNLWSNEIGDEGAIMIAKNLKCVLSLNLENNKIGYKGAREISKNIKTLSTLYLGFNNIGDLGVKTIVENLKLLNSLYLENCQISDKGSEVFYKNFSQFKNLILINNKISNLSSFTPLLKNKSKIEFVFDNEDRYSGFNISNNPIVEPPIEVVNQGKEAIIRYFENIEKEKKVELEPYINKEVKLILAGNSNAGKSTLVKYLTDGVVDKKLPSTHWMEVKNWEKPFPDNMNIENIRIFDFGGQEYYHDTHYLFFTNNTGYLLLWDAYGNVFKEIEVEQKSAICQTIKKVNIQCFPLEYWMDAISHFTRSKADDNIPPEGRQISKFYRVLPNETMDEAEIRIRDFEDKYYNGVKPPLLILQNKVDIGRSIKLPMDKYEEQYKHVDIVDAVYISLHENRKLENLKQTILELINDMHIVGGKFQGTYGIIRKGLLQYSGSTSLLFEEFKQLCNDWITEAGNRAGIDYSSLFFARNDALDCVNVFSWLGYVLFFPESKNLNNKVFLDQKRITDAIYNILFDAEATLGEISKKTAKTKVQLQGQELNDIFDLMQEFKIIFKHPDLLKKDTYIAPLYLSNHPIKGINFFLSSLQKPIYRIQYDGFIHKSIILEFFQEYGQHVLKESNLHHEDVFYYWRKGIVVKKLAETGMECLVLVQFFDGEDTQDNDSKTIRIPAHIDIFSLKEGSEDLINEIKDKLEEMNKGWKVTELVTVDGFHFVPLSEILKHETNKQYVFQYADQQFQLIHFKQYLKYKNEYPMKKIFISYSKSDEHYRNELEKHLSVLKRNGHIATWHDRKLLPGEKWDGKIRQELKEADIVLFLVSADFLATDYIWDVELGTALERDNDPNDALSVVPIILRKCDWMDSPLGKFNSPVKGKDISTAIDKDEAIYEIVQELKKLIKP